MENNLTSINVYTLGFTKKNAEKFFGLIKKEGIAKIIDVRLNNISQLAGFAKKDDLAFFLKELCNAEYIYTPELAPTKTILDPYKKGEMSWKIYEEEFLNLMSRRSIEKTVAPELLDNGCLLCSEHEPHLCHRRLVVEYLNGFSGFNIKIKHLY